MGRISIEGRPGQQSLYFHRILLDLLKLYHKVVIILMYQVYTYIYI